MLTGRKLLRVCSLFGNLGREFSGACTEIRRDTYQLIGATGTDDIISRAFEGIVAEMTAPRPGTAAMLSALFQQCFIEVLRRQGAGDEGVPEWLSALDDPRLSNVIDAIIEAPGEPYTLELLAEKCLMSRTAFSERFHRTFGRTAMDFVREVRLRGAARLLKQTQDPIKTIAARMGYASRSNFSHAFRDFFGVRPAEYRATGLAPGT